MTGIRGTPPGGTIGRNAFEVAVDRIDQGQLGRRVVGQRVRDDRPRSITRMPNPLFNIAASPWRGFGAWLLTLTSAGIANRLVLLPRPAHDPADEVEGASEIQDTVSCRELREYERALVQ